MLQDEAGVVLLCQFGGKAGHHVAALEQAEGAKDGAGGEVAEGSVDDIGADDEDRHLGGAQHGFGHRADQQLADGAGRVGAHDDAVDFAFPQVSARIWSAGRPGRTTISQRSPRSARARRAVQECCISARAAAA